MLDDFDQPVKNYVHLLIREIIIKYIIFNVVVSKLFATEYGGITILCHYLSENCNTFLWRYKCFTATSKFIPVCITKVDHKFRITMKKHQCRRWRRPLFQVIGSYKGHNSKSTLPKIHMAMDVYDQSVNGVNPIRIHTAHVLFSTRSTIDHDQPPTNSYDFFINQA